MAAGHLPGWLLHNPLGLVKKIPPKVDNLIKNTVKNSLLIIYRVGGGHKLPGRGAGE
jgi:hypothetical protein